MRTKNATRNKETDEISKKLDVSKRESERLKKQGVTPESANAIQAAKLRKELAMIAKLEFQLEILKRNYIPRTEALQYGKELADIVMQWAGEAMTNYPTSHADKDERAFMNAIHASTEKLLRLP
jgi:hypothetical protein